MSRENQSVRDIFLGVLSRNSQKVPTIEIRAFILNAARDNGYDLSESGDLDAFEIVFPTGETISFDGQDWRFDRE